MKTIIIVCLSIFSQLSYGQKRIDGEMINFDKKGEIFTEANFYYYDKDHEKWVEKLNAVEDYFGSPQFMTMNYNSETYYVLVSKSVDVRYKYPNLKLERYLVPIYKGYVFNKNEFLNLTSYSDARSISEELRTDKLDIDELRIMVVEVLKKERYQSGYFVLKVKKENENTIRFRFPENQSYYNTAFDKLYFETSKLAFDNFIKLN